MQRFTNKTALITGGTNGMGFATAQAFIREGASVIITGRSQATLNQALETLGPQATGIVSDAGNMAHIQALPDQVRQHHAQIDILFVNAGYGKFASLEQANEQHFDELFNVLVKGTFFTVQGLLPLIPQGGSMIFNTSFVTAFGIENFSVYTAAKSAVQSFIKTFSMECTAKGIRVNGISPGYINTNIYSNTGLAPDQVQAMINGIAPSLPFKRFGEPGEIAGAVLFLASDDAAYVHGAELLVDGGVSNAK